MEFERSRYPDLPGVYLMKDGEGRTIYIGKAGSLRSRLSQYFIGRVEGKTAALVANVHEVEFVVAKDENEALILESNLIKSNMPKFNMLLKDAKHYSYLAITGEKFPRLLVARKNSEGRFRIANAKFYGPYVEGSKRAISANYLRRLFRIRTCSKMPKKACLQYHLGNCDAPCIGKVGAEEYMANVRALGQVLMGKRASRDIIGEMDERMHVAARAQDYERAKTLRDQIEAIKIFFRRQRVEGGRGDEDFVFLKVIGDVLNVRILKSREGVIRQTERHAMEIRAQEDPETTFCAQYYSDQSEIPDRVYSNLGKESMEKLNAAMGTKLFFEAGREKQEVLRIASDSLEQAELEPGVLRLQEALGLAQPPLVIETFDISNLFGENSVGSMVRFVNGRPDKAGYRKFRIRGVAGQDDFAMMGEVVGRRYRRLGEEMGQMPDLVLIDGGLGQLHAAKSALDALGLELNVASLAKKEEEIYLISREKPLRLQRADLGLRLLQHCRDEAHRFAIGFHRQRRSKVMENDGS